MLEWGCATQPVQDETYVVQRSDTLYSIAWRHDLDYRELARWNHLGSDYRIAVGQVLNLRPPDGSAPVGAPAAARAAPRPRAAPAPGNSAPRGEGAAKTVVGAPRAPVGATAHWLWPTEHATAPRPVPGGGILFLGQLGQPVRAASAGRVVYVGNGLRGYGNLVIIKHGDTLLSAYAHNRELLVREGQEVTAGEPIGAMGTGPHQVAALYFEIRLNGKPVDPLPFLQ